MKKLILLTLLGVFLCGYTICTGQSGFAQQFKTQYWQLENYKVHYLKKGSGEPVLLLHGGGTWMYSWRNIIDSLALFCEVYACDLPGHGYTEVINEPKYTLNDYVDFINSFIDSQNLEKITLIGSSWGGGWGLYYAMIHPERVKNLILIDAAGLDVRDSFIWELLRVPGLGELLPKLVTRKMATDIYEEAYYDPSIITKGMVDEIFVPLKFRMNTRATCKIKRHCDWSITDTGMYKISVPTLILWGEYDFYPVDDGKLMAYRISEAELVVIKDCGHLPQEEQPSETLRVLKEYLMKKDTISLQKE